LSLLFELSLKGKAHEKVDYDNWYWSYWVLPLSESGVADGANGGMVSIASYRIPDN